MDTTVNLQPIRTYKDFKRTALTWTLNFRSSPPFARGLACVAFVAVLILYMAPLDSPRLRYSQLDFRALRKSNSVEKCRNAVRRALQHAWKGYRDLAWGHDELRPVSQETNDSWGGFGMTLVDALDTLWIMGLKDEFQEARDQIADLDFNKDVKVSVFETTIRILGGMLSAYTLSKDEIFLKKSVELADSMLPAFNTPTGIPVHSINLKTKEGGTPHWCQGMAMLAEAGSLQLEWKYLSHLTGNPIYAQKVQVFMDWIVALDANAFGGHVGKVKGSSVKLPEYQGDLGWSIDYISQHRGLWPTLVSVESGTFHGDEITWGGMADSFYEYLLKQYLLTGKTEEKYRQLYDQSVGSMLNLMIGESDNPKTRRGRGKGAKQHKYLGVLSRSSDSLGNEMDHLACFAPGLLALGANEGADSNPNPDVHSYMEMAEALGETCYATYRNAGTGLGPEIARFEGSQIETSNSKYLLRPETVESLFILWRKTHNPKYRKWAWRIFESIEAYCKTPYAYSGLRDVDDTRAPGPETWDNSMQSFFFAETLKYLYLIFSDDNLIPLDKYVFTTEAHPFEIFYPEDEAIA